MSTLVTYTFPATANLAGVIVRCYAAGRYLNNSGAQLLPTVSTAINTTTLCSIAMPVSPNTIAVAWRLWGHFYFSSVQTPNGVVPTIGGNVEVILSAPQASSTTTGTYVAQQFLQVFSNPYATTVLPSLTQSLAAAFTPAGGDSLEVHAAYMEVM